MVALTDGAIVCRKTIRNTKTTQRGVKRIYPERN